MANCGSPVKDCSTDEEGEVGRKPEEEEDVGPFKPGALHHPDLVAYDSLHGESEQKGQEVSGDEKELRQRAAHEARTMRISLQGLASLTCGLLFSKPTFRRAFCWMVDVGKKLPTSFGRFMSAFDSRAAPPGARPARGAERWHPS